jgi:hypothetical protein
MLTWLFQGLRFRFKKTGLMALVILSQYVVSYACVTLLLAYDKYICQSNTI